MTTEHDPIDDNETSRAHAKAVAHIERQAEQEDLRKVMSTKNGRRFVYRLIERAGIHRTTFRESPTESAFLEGQRDFGIFIEAEVNAACPNHYLTMLKEHTRG